MSIVAIFLSLGMAALVIGIVWVILKLVAQWIIFRKMGEPGWKCLIPIYKTYIIYKRCWLMKFFVIAMIAEILVSFSYYQSGTGGVVNVIFSVASVVALIMTYLENLQLAKAFGHGIPFAIGLLIFAPVFNMILAFGSDQYLGNPYE